MDRIILIITFSIFTVQSPVESAPSLAGLITSQHSQDEDAACYNFSVGNVRLQEFYSPGYPAKYLPKSDCILTLKADVGQIIRVDFRDQFVVEPHENCDYDFLEVRDGAHGYSPIMNKFCGRQFPPVITSSERYLWLRFSSDDTIEYSGFRGVYQFLPDLARKRPDRGACRIELSGLDGTFRSKDIPEEYINYTMTYNVPLDCTWVITVEEGKKIQLMFPHYSLGAPNECELNFIEVFGAKTDLQHRIKQFCGSVVEIVTSKTNVLHLRFFADLEVIKSSFEANFTAYTSYRDTEASGKCAPSEFDCEDATCVDMSLRCNGRINCKFRNDEENCTMVKNRLFSSTHLIIILCVGCFIMFGMCFRCFYNCFSKLRADHSVYQARRSRSREDRLDALDDRPASSNAGKKKMLMLTHSRAVLERLEQEDLDARLQRSRLVTNSSRSLSSAAAMQHNPITDSNGYVQSVARSDLQMKSDTTAVAADYESNVDDYEDEDEDSEPVEMVDHACQTHDSLYGAAGDSASENGACSPKASMTGVKLPPSGRSTPRNGSAGNHFKAEKTFEISRKHKPKTESSAKSSSAASSKSGPDVSIVYSK